MHPTRITAAALALLAVAGHASAQATAPTTLTPAPASAAAPRPMTFLDAQHMRQVGGTAVSPDGKLVLYTLSTPDWKEARRQTDIFLVSAEQGVASTRQLTFTKDKSESSPAWSRDGKFFVFASNREAPAASANQQQLYLMRPDGGEARKITEAKDPLSTFAFSPDGKWLAYRSGKADEEQLYLLPVAGLDSARATPLTRHPSGVGQWRWAPDGRRIYFVTADTVDRDEKLRTEKKFTVSVRNAETPRSSLWALDVPAAAPAQPVRATRLTRDTSVTVTQFVISDDGRWVGFTGIDANRYRRGITEQGINGDLFLLETASGQIERLTDNREVPENGLAFSPDSKWLAFAAPDDMTRYSMTNARVYLRRVDDRGGRLRKLGAAFDGDVTVGFWSKDGKTIYFNEGVRATNQLMALDVEKDAVRQVTKERASVAANQDDDSKRILISYADPKTPPTLYTVASPE